jgi:hypothetical protein
VSEKGPSPASPSRAVERSLAALDAVIAGCAALVLVYLVAGRIDLGFLTVNRVSKPFLVLLLLASLRAAIPRGSWLTRRLGRARARVAGAVAAAERRTPWAAAAVDAAVAVLTVHVVAKVTTFYANMLFPQAQAGQPAMPFEAARFAQAFAAWDSGWYFEIARRGYFVNAEGQNAIAFFPLYPLLVRALAWPFGGTERALWVAGVVLSYACLFLGLVVLHRLTSARFGDRETARRTVLYLAVFPFAFFFTMVYTESLFLFLSVSAVAAATASRWGLAGALGFLVALTRPNGVLIAVPLGLLALGGRPRPLELARRALAVALVPAGLGVYSAFAWRLTGDPLGWLHAQNAWGYTLGNRPWVELMKVLDGLERFGAYGYFFSDPLAPYYFLHGAVALAVIALVPTVFARLGVALGAYVAVTLYVPLTGNALEGIGRYTATLFPVFMLFGSATSKRVHEALLVAGALVLSLLAGLFITFHKVY